MWRSEPLLARDEFGIQISSAILMNLAARAALVLEWRWDLEMSSTILLNWIARAFFSETDEFWVRATLVVNWRWMKWRIEARFSVLMNVEIGATLGAMKTKIRYVLSDLMILEIWATLGVITMRIDDIFSDPDELENWSYASDPDEIWKWERPLTWNDDGKQSCPRWWCWFWEFEQF